MGERGSTYRDLIAWQKAMDMVVAIYAASRPFPSLEQFGLTAQLRKSAISVVSNIAEGQARGSINDFIRFLHISRGSLAEAETQLLVGHRLEYVTRDVIRPAWDVMQDVGRLLNGLIESMETRRDSRA